MALRIFRPEDCQREISQQVKAVVNRSAGLAGASRISLGTLRRSQPALSRWVRLSLLQCILGF